VLLGVFTLADASRLGELESCGAGPCGSTDVGTKACDTDGNPGLLRALNEVMPPSFGSGKEAARSEGVLNKIFRRLNVNRAKGDLCRENSA